MIKSMAGFQESIKPTVRIDALLAQKGCCARRKAQNFLQERAVSADGARIEAAGQRVAADAVLAIDGKVLEAGQEKLYFALNKPKGYICSSYDPQGRPLALSLLPKRAGRLYSVGRLDLWSCGLIFFTNDGAFAQSIAHPSLQIEKEYYVETTQPFERGLLDSFCQGVSSEGVFYKVKACRSADGSPAPRQMRAAFITLTEGKNREIRRLFAAFGYKIKLLKRLRIGCAALGDLAEGSFRLLAKEELAFFEKKAARRLTRPAALV